MDLSPGEEAIVELLRGEPAIDFAMTVYRSGDVWTVSISSESDGILAGQGDTFRHALHVAFGVDGTSDDGEPVPEPARVLRLVAGIDHKSFSPPTAGAEVQPAVTEHRQRAPLSLRPNPHVSVPAARRGGATI